MLEKRFSFDQQIAKIPTSERPLMEIVAWIPKGPTGFFSVGLGPQIPLWLAFGFYMDCGALTQMDPILDHHLESQILDPKCAHVLFSGSTALSIF